MWSRREFIKKASLLGVGIPASILMTCSKEDATNDKQIDDETARYTEKIRFGICADVHHDFFYGASERMTEFINVMNSEKVDFIIQLGDFCSKYR